jgi:MFS family permease
MTFFRAKRAIAGGLTSAGSSLGGVILPLMVQHLIPQIGFGWTMRTCAFLILAFLTFALLTVRSNLEHKPTPFGLMQYVRPLRETNFAILTGASFLMYCMLEGEPCAMAPS